MRIVFPAVLPGGDLSVLRFECGPNGNMHGHGLSYCVGNPSLSVLREELGDVAAGDFDGGEQLKAEREFQNESKVRFVSQPELLAEVFEDVPPAPAPHAASRRKKVLQRSNTEDAVVRATREEPVRDRAMSEQEFTDFFLGCVRSGILVSQKKESAGCVLIGIRRWVRTISKWIVMTMV
jgi:hypothetical protein